MDLMRGLDYVLANNVWMDSDRICAGGASYGGYVSLHVFSCISSKNIENE